MKKVLVVEDDKIFAKVHSHFVKKAMHIDAIISDNARDAIQYLQEKDQAKGTCLILLDLNMPEMNGWEFLDAISNNDEFQNILVIIVTSSLYSEDYKRSKAYDKVIGYFTKPLKFEEIEELFIKERIISINQTVNDS